MKDTTDVPDNITPVLCNVDNLRRIDSNADELDLDLSITESSRNINEQNEDLINVKV